MLADSSSLASPDLEASVGPPPPKTARPQTEAEGREGRGEDM